MGRSVKFVNRKYFQRLLSGLLIFILFLHFPFSFAVQRVSKESVINNINTANQTVLEQLHSNYTSVSDNISSLAASIFWRADIQKLLYSPSLEYEDIYFILLDLRQTFMLSHPDLHSICLYNKYTEELYVVSTTDNISKGEFLDFVNSQDRITLLQPTLHTLSLSNSSRQSDPMIFSHFMYQFNDPSQSNESFLVLNQYADQAVSTIDTFSGTSDSIPTATYYVTEDAYISSKHLSSDVTQAHNYLIDKFRNQRNELPSTGSCYEDSYNTNKYLITYIHTKFENASLLIIQDYDLVFHEINTLTHRFSLITIIFSVIAILLAFFITQQLYKPINKMYDFFAEKEVDAMYLPHRRVNELDIIKHVYQTASEQNQTLANQSNRYMPIALQYGISSLLLANNRHGIEQFRRAHPSHWLSTFQAGQLSIVLLKVVLSTDAVKRPKEADRSLLLFGLQNVTEELLTPNYNFACFQHAQDTLGILISPKNGCSDEELYSVLEQTRSFMVEHFALSVTAAVSSHSNSLSSLSVLLQEATTCLSYMFLLGPTVITTSQIVSNKNNNQAVYPSDLDLKIEDCIMRKDIEGCQKILAEIKTVIRQFNIENAVICTTGLLNQVQRLLSKYPGPVGLPPSVSPLTMVYGYISDSGTIDQCFDAIFNHIHVHIVGQNYESKSSNELFVNTVFDFVQNSYFDHNLSSQLIADHLGLSNRYLMKKFKALTGISLNEHITDLRLRMAAMLLRDTDSPISSIAEQVGIDNLSYFYRLFKRVYGCTPKEFRENGGTTSEA